MDSIAELRARLENERPCDWDSLPDLALYMDQVISYLPRQLIAFDAADDGLTPAMVNNYIKSGLLPRAEGKRYGKTHLAYLTAICALKQVLSVHEMGVLLGEAHGRQYDALYALFGDTLDAALTRTAGELTARDEDTRDALARQALELALHSYASKAACRQLLAMLERTAPESPHGHKKEMD